jgi:hypothetical protein
MAFHGFIKALKDVIKSGFQFLPLFLGVALLVFGSITANYAFLYVFLGMFALAPLANYIMYQLTSLLSVFIRGAALFKKGEALAPFDEPTDPSFGFSIMIFFFTYLLTNAAYLIKEHKESTTTDQLVRSRAIISIILVGIAAVAYIGLRIKNNENVAETPLGMFVLASTSAAVAYGWFYLMYSCGKMSVADVYGIENNALVSLYTNKVCLAISE